MPSYDPTLYKGVPENYKPTWLPALPGQTRKIFTVLGKLIKDSMKKEDGN